MQAYHVFRIRSDAKESLEQLNELKGETWNECMHVWDYMADSSQDDLAKVIFSFFL